MYHPKASEAYRALQQAAEEIGAHNWRLAVYRPRKHRGRLVKGYQVTPEHERVIAASSQVLAGQITPEEALAILEEPEIKAQRVPISPR